MTLFITRAFPRWEVMEPLERAQATIDWCQDNGIDTSSITARGLAAAMALQPPLDRGMRGHLDMIRTIAAYLAAC